MKIKNITKSQSFKIVGGGLPDVDSDFQASRRDEVVSYLQRRYGNSRVARVGTYSTYSAKSIIQDFGRVKGVSPVDRNILSKMVDEVDPHGEWGTIKDEFAKTLINASFKPFLKKFINEQPEIINAIKVVTDQPTNKGAHACAFLLVPKVDRFNQPSDVFKLIPTRTVEGEVLTEWEGGICEAAGLLKNDFLGLKQMDKIENIVKLHFHHTGESINYLRIPLNDELTMKAFRQGFTSDNFHFGTDGLRNHIIDMQPDDINDLIAAVALHRPGAIETGAENNYVQIKNGKKIAEYDFGCEKLLQDTHGQIIYQEQIMTIVKVLGDFTLVETDDVRRAIGKKMQAKLDGYKDRFIKGVVDKGGQVVDALTIWGKIEKAGGYSFNKSHAASYALLGYISQYLKVHYPTAYWTTALQDANDKDIVKFSGEIKRIGHKVSIRPPDINNSAGQFTTKYKTGEIFWSLNKIKQVGAAATQQIIADRNENGQYFSLEEFCKRVRGKSVTIRTIHNLIIAGAFDILHDVKETSDRFQLVVDLYSTDKKALPEIYKSNSALNSIFWSLLQRHVCGLGVIDYKKLIANTPNIVSGASNYINGIDILGSKFVGKTVTTAGIISEVKVRKSKNGPFAEVTLINDSEIITVTVWNEVWTEFEHQFEDTEDKICIVYNGKCVSDTWKKKNVIHSSKGTKIIVL